LPQKPYWILECGYPNAALWKGDARLLEWFKLLDLQGAEYRPDGVTFWILGEKEDWGNIFSPGGVIRPFVYNLKKYLNEREEAVTPQPSPPEPEPEPTTEIDIFNQQKGWTASRFASYLSCWKPFAEIREVFIHHTVNPTPATWRGRESMLAMKRVYEQRGWTAGPHVFVAPDGVWVFTPVNKQGVGCVGHNDHAIHVEIVGNYEENALVGEMRGRTIEAFAAICQWLQYDPMFLLFHRDCAATVCPGKNIDKGFKHDILDYIILREAAARISVEPVRVNEDAALYKWARDKRYGAPLTNEFEVCHRIAQGFALCILSCTAGAFAFVNATGW